MDIESDVSSPVDGERDSSRTASTASVSSVMTDDSPSSTPPHEQENIDNSESKVESNESFFPTPDRTVSFVPITKNFGKTTAPSLTSAKRKRKAKVSTCATRKKQSKDSSAHTKPKTKVNGKARRRSFRLNTTKSDRDAHNDNDLLMVVGKRKFYRMVVLSCDSNDSKCNRIGSRKRRQQCTMCTGEFHVDCVADEGWKFSADGRGPCCNTCQVCGKLILDQEDYLHCKSCSDSGAGENMVHLQCVPKRLRGVVKCVCANVFV